MRFGKQRFEVGEATTGAGKIPVRPRSHVFHVKNRVVTAVFWEYSQRVGPAFDGVQLRETLETDGCTSHVPVPLLTSRSSTESKVKGLSAGTDDYATKPFNLAVLFGQLGNLIHNRRRLQNKYSRY